MALVGEGSLARSSGQVQSDSQAESLGAAFRRLRPALRFLRSITTHFHAAAGRTSLDVCISGLSTLKHRRDDRSELQSVGGVSHFPTTRNPHCHLWHFAPSARCVGALKYLLSPKIMTLEKLRPLLLHVCNAPSKMPLPDSCLNSRAELNTQTGSFLFFFFQSMTAFSHFLTTPARSGVT